MFFCVKTEIFIEFNLNCFRRVVDHHTLYVIIIECHKQYKGL